MARNVPKFGNWENDDNVPYTVYFDKARKNRGGKMINPNDPQENPDMFPTTDPSPVMGRGAGTGSEKDGDLRQFNKSPAQGESNYGGRGQRSARPVRASAGSEQSSEHSPLHPHYQAKVVGMGSGSPSWEGRSSDTTHGNQGRSRLKPSARGDDSPDKGAAVPRFGAWDENDPQAAENFTDIFNKVREERNTGPGNVSGTPKHPSYVAQKPQANAKKKCCCFTW